MTTFVQRSLMAALLSLCACTGFAAPADDAAATVLAFNEKVSARDLDGLLGLIAKGGIQFTLRPSHQGLETDSISTELAPRWQMVGPVLFSATKSYSRKATVVDARAMGDVATVWVEIDSATVMASNNQARTDKFSEVYMLVRTTDGWKIAGVADNRQPDNIGIGGN